MATGMLINALVEVLFMPNCANFSELIRTGDLDFALLKPIDTQFLVSFERIDLAMLAQVVLAGALLIYSLTTSGSTSPRSPATRRGFSAPEPGGAR
jgi:ABC-2 type transport system permease protein